jgi:hypothetical protein
MPVPLARPGARLEDRQVDAELVEARVLADCTGTAVRSIFLLMGPG